MCFSFHTISNSEGDFELVTNVQVQLLQCDLIERQNPSPILDPRRAFLFPATDARVIWTAYYVEDRTTHLFALHADPELIRQNLSPQRTVSVEHYFNSTGSQSEIWTVTSDYASRRIFFADYRYLIFLLIVELS